MTEDFKRALMAVSDQQIAELDREAGAGTGYELVSSEKFASSLVDGPEAARRVVAMVNEVTEERDRHFMEAIAAEAEAEFHDIEDFYEGEFHSDIRAFALPDHFGEAPGFCAGCGAHHVRALGRMLCADCNEEFRDIG